jgi:hypothetical protein
VEPNAKLAIIMRPDGTRIQKAKAFIFGKAMSRAPMRIGTNVVAETGEGRDERRRRA